MNRFLGVCSIGIAIVSAIVSPVYGGDLPHMLFCSANAHAGRDFAFAGKRWTNIKGLAFDLRNAPGQYDFESLRDRVFTGLNSGAGRMRSIPRQDPQAAEEFETVTLGRFDSSTFLTWSNPPGNKAWLAVVDGQTRKAVVVRVFQGITSVGGSIETLDCR